MSPQEKSNLRSKIEATILKTEAEVLRLEIATQPIAPENSIGRLSRMDAINNKSVAEAALRSARSRLGRLRVALTKIDTPNFGQCARCGTDIQLKRLMYLPESTYCIRCAR